MCAAIPHIATPITFCQINDLLNDLDILLMSAYGKFTTTNSGPLLSQKQERRLTMEKQVLKLYITVKQSLKVPSRPDSTHDVRKTNRKRFTKTQITFQ